MPRTIVPALDAWVMRAVGIGLGLDAQMAFDAGDGIDDERVFMARSLSSTRLSATSSTRLFDRLVPFEVRLPVVEACWRQLEQRGDRKLGAGVLDLRHLELEHLVAQSSARVIGTTPPPPPQHQLDAPWSAHLLELEPERRQHDARRLDGAAAPRRPGRDRGTTRLVCRHQLHLEPAGDQVLRPGIPTYA